MTADTDSLISRFVPADEQNRLVDFFYTLRRQEKKHLLQNDLRLLFRAYRDERELEDSPGIADFLRSVPELLVGPECFYVMHRCEIARYRFYQWSGDGGFVEEISPRFYLEQRERVVLGADCPPGRPLEIDFSSFSDYAPSMRDSRGIGDGIRFLNRHLSSSLFQQPEKWKRHLYEFMSLHRTHGQPLLLNGEMPADLNAFREHLRRAITWLHKQPAETAYDELKGELKEWGFEPGWGDTVKRVRETMELLDELLEAPDSDLLERFMARIPMIFEIAIVSPHGWFAQENALGKPDTGGQIIYILDQVRALEAGLRRDLQACGLGGVEARIIVLTRLIPEARDTTCNVRLEKIHRTRNAWILRVPFHDAEGAVVPHWLSRFDVWPYLDRFAEESGRELRSELGGTPDLIIGNYSDGNLVATLLSDEMDVIQCTVAHALEKSKYLFSDLYWERMEDEYHFSLQFTADLITMNKSDFVIASTYQEIAGTGDSIGQYESYQFFSLPGHYRVVNGVDLFNPRFNIVPPGVDEENYFPHTATDKRSESADQHWRERLFLAPAEDVHGRLDDPEKPAIFTMARLDRIKNITGLIEAFGQSAPLRERCNLVFAAGMIREEDSGDREERAEIRKAHELIERYDLEGQVRWLPSIEKRETGTVYRLIADLGGVFVQPALFEAFGLTILEAMLSGLPTFGPKFGGPTEIIAHGENGFLMNTSEPALMAAVLEEFFQRVDEDPGYWKQISEQGIERVRTRFTWHLYSDKLVSLAKLYGFWRYAVAGKGMEKLDRYCEVLYHFLLKERAEGSLHPSTGVSEKPLPDPSGEPRGLPGKNQ